MNSALPGLDCWEFRDIIVGIMGTTDEVTIAVVVNGISIICDNEQVWHLRNELQLGTITSCNLYNAMNIHKVSQPYTVLLSPGHQLATRPQRDRADTGAIATPTD